MLRNSTTTIPRIKQNQADNVIENRDKQSYQKNRIIAERAIVPT